MHFGTLSIFQNYRDGQSDQDVVKGELALAKLAEDTGFDSFWAVEHHFFPYSMCPDNFQFLAQVAGQTKRIGLGTGAVIVPWNDPYRIAAKAALLDNQSGGRALLGFGRGLARREYAAMNVAMDEARGRFDEGTQLVLEALEKGRLRGGYALLPASALHAPAAAGADVLRSRLLHRRLAGLGGACGRDRGQADGARAAAPGKSSASRPSSPIRRSGARSAARPR
jgi:alkanesulfonate monooxygenase SsuD/methylene tetrahydromethanopterin reductase-like flavin-dependent oxidoreductase (luciferase family)